MSVLYFFHHLDAVPRAWFHIVNFDPWTEVRFYPLAFVIVYAFHRVFGQHFAAAHISHIGIYFLLVICLYRLIRDTGGRLLPVLACLGVFTFLYSHSDIIVWNLHTYIIIACVCMLAGFHFYMRYVNTGMLRHVYAAGVLFCAGMLCYETYALWPLGIFFLGSGVDERRAARLERPLAARYVQWRLLYGVYGIYILVFFLTRLLRTYEYSMSKFLSFFSPEAALYALAAPLGFLA